MTERSLYTFRMNILMSLPVKGMLLTILLFAVCFVGVHVIILARLGWEYQTRKEKPAENPPEKSKEEEKKPLMEKEPIYYIVERKTKRAKASYGEPKQINFKP